MQLEEEPRFNIAPTDPVLAIRELEDGGRDAGRLRWGLMAGREAGAHKSLINARAETLDSKPAFRESFRERRCLVPADGFYEWRTDGQGKQPMWINRADDDLFAFAGIWAEAPGRNGTPVFSLRDRDLRAERADAPDPRPHAGDPRSRRRGGMAVAPRPTPEELLALLRPAPEDALQAREVTDAVNNVRNDGPGLLESPLRLF